MSSINVVHKCIEIKKIFKCEKGKYLGYVKYSILHNINYSTNVHYVV